MKRANCRSRKDLVIASMPLRYRSNDRSLLVADELYIAPSLVILSRKIARKIAGGIIMLVCWGKKPDTAAPAGYSREVALHI